MIRLAAALVVCLAAFSALSNYAAARRSPPRPSTAPIPPSHLREAYFGGGCFWCLEAAFERLEGVGDVQSGYAGGTVDHPSYEAVCTGDTGHAEVVRIPYDARRLSYQDLLRVFLAVHDPTTRDRQGPDVGSQYRSIVLVQTDTERAETAASIRAAQAGLKAPVVTQVVTLARFWPAEPEHQDYFARHPNVPYCATVIAPKLEKVERGFRPLLKAGPGPQ